MGDSFHTNPAKNNYLGAPLVPIEGDRVEIVEGTLGNPILLNGKDMFIDPQNGDTHGNPFYMLVTGSKNKKALEVAKNFAANHHIVIRPQNNNDEFELKVLPEKSGHYLDPAFTDKLRFRPDLHHLQALYGDKADFFMLAVQLPNQKAKIFGDDFRKVAGSTETRDVRKFDLVQKSADHVVETMHRGGLAIYSRESGSHNLYGVVLSDIHLARRNDELLKKIVEEVMQKDPEKGRDMLVRFNNANAVIEEGIIPWLNEQYDAGLLDFVMVLGDNVDFDGTNHQVSTNLAESNHALVARLMAKIKAPTFVGLGNHDVLPEADPLWVRAKNFGLTKEEASLLEKDRFGGIAGTWRFVKDAVQSASNDPNAVIGYYDTINRFPDFSINFAKAGPASATARDLKLVFMDMHGADVMHDRQDDPVYQQAFGLWPWGFPYLHPKNIYEFFAKESPSLSGPTHAQSAWLGQQVSGNPTHSYVFRHSPLINTDPETDPVAIKEPPEIDHLTTNPKEAAKRLQKAAEENQQRVKALKTLTPDSSYRERTFNTTVHAPNELDVIMSSPNVRGGMGGHAHTNRHDDSVVVRTLDNDYRVYRGSIRHALGENNKTPNVDEETRRFWFPDQHCRKDDVNPSCKFQNGTVAQAADRKFFWQMGASGVGDPPVFLRMTINPDGLISNLEDFFVMKNLTPDQPEAGITYSIRQKPHANADVAKAMIPFANKHNIPLNSEGILQRANARLESKDVSFMPRPASDNAYPRFNEYVDPAQSYISPTKLTYQTSFKANMPALARDFVKLRTLNSSPLLLSANYAFSQAAVPPVGRMFFEGIETGFRVGGCRDPYAYVAATSATLFDLKLGKDFILRGPQVSLGLGLGDGDLIYTGVNWADLSFHQTTTAGFPFFVRVNYETNSASTVEGASWRHIKAGFGWQW